MRARKIQIRRADCHNGPFRRGEEHAHERSRRLQVIIYAHTHITRVCLLLLLLVMCACEYPARTRLVTVL